MSTDTIIVKCEANLLSPILTRNPSLHVVKSRKENKQQSPTLEEKSGFLDTTRTFPQSLASNVGGDNKRQCVVTPAAFEVIDEEDEPDKKDFASGFDARKGTENP